MRNLSALVLLTVSVTACAGAGTDGYPSLAKRPIETQFDVAESVPLPPPGPLPADLAGRMARWRAQSADAEAAFAAALPGVDAAIAGAERAPVASEAWIAAQQALSRLAITRGPLADALGDVDALYVARQDGGAVDGLGEILELRDALASSLAGQNAQLAALAERLAK